MIDRLHFNPLPPLHGDELHVEYSTPGDRGPGWYWWVTGFDNEKTGPFQTEQDANHDISMLRIEASMTDW